MVLAYNFFGWTENILCLVGEFCVWLENFLWLVGESFVVRIFCGWLENIFCGWTENIFVMVGEFFCGWSENDRVREDGTRINGTAVSARWVGKGGLSFEFIFLGYLCGKG